MDNSPFVDTSNSQWIFHCHVWWHRRVNEQIAAMFHWDDWRQWLGDIPCEGLISMFSEVLWSAGLIFLDFDVLLRKTIRFQWILGHFYLNHHFCEFCWLQVGCYETRKSLNEPAKRFDNFFVWSLFGSWGRRKRQWCNERSPHLSVLTIFPWFPMVFLWFS